MDVEFAELKNKFSELDGKFATKQDLERVETALLTEFRKKTLPMDARARTRAVVMRAIDLDRKLGELYQ